MTWAPRWACPQTHPSWTPAYKLLAYAWYNGARLHSTLGHLSPAEFNASTGKEDLRQTEPLPVWWTPDLPGCAWRRESQWAHELGIGESNLSYWLKKDTEGRAGADPGRFEAESAAARENAVLRRRVAELEVEREILKRATAFWVKESRA